MLRYSIGRMHKLLDLRLACSSSIFHGADIPQDMDFPTGEGWLDAGIAYIDGAVMQLPLPDALAAGLVDVPLIISTMAYESAIMPGRNVSGEGGVEGSGCVSAVVLRHLSLLALFHVCIRTRVQFNRSHGLAVARNVGDRLYSQPKRECE